LATLKEAYAPFYPNFDEARWQGFMSDFGLDPRKKAKELSLGQRTRFALTLALARDWDLLVLDEPTTGLDPVFRRELIQRFSERLDERRSILFSTHITSDLEGKADYVTFLRNGEVVLCDTQDRVKEHWGIVKGGLELLDEKVRRAFQGLRETSLGFEALTNNVAGAREHFGDKALIERASLEDILVLLGRRAHA
jgi:ABC-2 type transport system ATP-binding protein